jgi:hypothetical protein
MKHFYYNNCVNWDRDDVDAEGGLCEMVDNAIDITRSTFLKHVDRDSLQEVERNLGYPMGRLRMSGDFAVQYYRSKLHDTTVYFFKHSAIEYVFLPSPTSEEILENKY